MKVRRIIKQGLVVASKGGFSVLVLVTKRQMKSVQKYISGLNLDIPVEVVLRCPCGGYPERSCKCSEDDLISYWERNRKLLDADMIIDGLGTKPIIKFTSHGGLSPALFTRDASEAVSLLFHAGKLTMYEYQKIRKIAGVLAALSPVIEDSIMLIDDVHILEATRFVKMRERIENLGYRYINRNLNLIKEEQNGD